MKICVSATRRSGVVIDGRVMKTPEDAFRDSMHNTQKLAAAKKRKDAALKTEEGLVKEIARLQERLKKLRAKAK